MMNIPVVNVKSKMTDKEIDDLNTCVHQTSNYQMLCIFRVNTHTHTHRERERERERERQRERTQFYLYKDP